MTEEEQITTQETVNPCWYSNSAKAFFIQNSRQHYIQISTDMLKKHLRSWGYATRAAPDENISQADQIMLDVQTNRDVDYSGSLAGYDAGIVECNGYRALVTKAPSRITAKKGEFPIICQIIKDMFWVKSFDQRDHFFGWLKKAEEAVRLSKPMPGQVLVLAGPRNAGKNLIQDIITEILGGRSARPYQWIIGRTNFNADLFSAEHLMIADEVPSHDMKSRRAFGAKIKDLAVNSVQTCHGKFQNAVHLKPCWRLTISVNEEAENLVMLPPLEESLKDKIMLFRVNAANMPMPSNSPEARALFWQTIKAELPAFIHFLQKWEIPENLVDSRFGIDAYQDPDLIEGLEGMSHEQRLMDLIEMTILPAGHPFEASLTQLESRLTSDPDFGRQVSKLLSFPNAMKTYMTRLKQMQPNRISYRQSNGKGLWLIQP
ncbi:hypothetical protein OAK90_01145 [bacterium]|nr:hypothetical protein [bacterium]MDC0277042.1 hypothetical protein [bacterium]